MPPSIGCIRLSRLKSRREQYHPPRRPRLRTQEKHLRAPGQKLTLMGLDFFLAYPELRYLLTENKQLEFLARVLGLKREWLLLRIYRSRMVAARLPGISWTVSRCFSLARPSRHRLWSRFAA